MKRLLALLAVVVAVAAPLWAAEVIHDFGLFNKAAGTSGSFQQQLAMRILGSKPEAIADGNAVNFDCRGMRLLTIITGAGATATYSKVDSLDTESHDSATDATQGANTDASIDVRWTFMRVSSAGGATRAACVP